MNKNLKVAFLVQCHKNPNQVNHLVDSLLKVTNIDVFIHVDQKSEKIRSQIKSNSFVHILPKKKCVNVKWGEISQCIATLNLIEEALKYDKFDFYILISGQDYLIKKVDTLIDFLYEHKNEGFMEFVPEENEGYYHFDKRNDLYYPAWMINKKFYVRVLRKLYVTFTGIHKTLKIFSRKRYFDHMYYGSSWWCLPEDSIKVIFQYCQEHPKLLEYFKHSICPDESLFQTLIKNLCSEVVINDNLTYVDWSEGGSSPKNLDFDDLDSILKMKDKFFARKFDEDLNPGILDRLDSMIDEMG